MNKNYNFTQQGDIFLEYIFSIDYRRIPGKYQIEKIGFPTTFYNACLSQIYFSQFSFSSPHSTGKQFYFL